MRLSEWRDKAAANAAAEGWARGRAAQLIAEVAPEEDPVVFGDAVYPSRESTEPNVTLTAYVALEVGLAVVVIQFEPLSGNAASVSLTVEPWRTVTANLEIAGQNDARLQPTLTLGDHVVKSRPAEQADLIALFQAVANKIG